GGTPVEARDRTPFDSGPRPDEVVADQTVARAEPDTARTPSLLFPRSGHLLSSSDALTVPGWAPGRPLLYPEANRLILDDEARKMLRQLDPRNRMLQVPNPSDWVPTFRDIDAVNAQIKAIRQQQGLRALERHHEFARQYQDWFRAQGI